MSDEERPKQIDIPLLTNGLSAAAQPPMMRGKRHKGRPVKHGLYSKYALVPLTHDKYKEIMGVMSGLRLLIAPSDQIVVNLLARLLAQIELIGRYLAEHDFLELDGQGNKVVSPLLSQYFAAIKHASGICSQLGLTTESRIKLTKGMAITEDLASKIQRAKQE
jgi:phage terminase small subunit